MWRIIQGDGTELLQNLLPQSEFSWTENKLGFVWNQWASLLFYWCERSVTNKKLSQGRCVCYFHHSHNGWSCLPPISWISSRPTPLLLGGVRDNHTGFHFWGKRETWAPCCVQTGHATWEFIKGKQGWGYGGPRVSNEMNEYVSINYLKYSNISSFYSLINYCIVLCSSSSWSHLHQSL